MTSEFSHGFIVEQVDLIETIAAEIGKAAIALSEKSREITPEAMELAVFASRLLNQAGDLKKISNKIGGSTPKS